MYVECSQCAQNVLKKILHMTKLYAQEAKIFNKIKTQQESLLFMHTT